MCTCVSVHVHVCVLEKEADAHCYCCSTIGWRRNLLRQWETRKTWRSSEFCDIILYSQCYNQPVLLFSLAQQVEAQDRQDHQLNELTKELEAAISDRDSLKENHQAVRQEMEEVKAELALTQAKWVSYGVKSVTLQYIRFILIQFPDWLSWMQLFGHSSDIICVGHALEQNVQTLNGSRYSLWRQEKRINQTWVPTMTVTCHWGSYHCIPKFCPPRKVPLHYYIPYSQAITAGNMILNQTAALYTTVLSSMRSGCSILFAGNQWSPLQ